MWRTFSFDGNWWESRLGPRKDNSEHSIGLKIYWSNRYREKWWRKLGLLVSQISVEYTISHESTWLSINIEFGKSPWMVGNGPITVTFVFPITQGLTTFLRERTKHLCGIMEEGYVIKYIDKFSGGLKQNKEFIIISFQQGPLFYCRRKMKERKKEKTTNTFNKKSICSVDIAKSS